MDIQKKERPQDRYNKKNIKQIAFRLNKKTDIDETKYILDNILTQQIIITKLSSITYQDTEQMDEYERRFIFEKLIQMKKEEDEIKLKALQNNKK